MRPSMHFTLIVGTLGKEPSIKMTKKGDAFTSLSVVVNEWYNNNNYATWYQVVGFKYVGELMAKARKGDTVQITGSITTGKYVNKEGQTVYTWSLKARDFLILRDNPGKGEDVPPDFPSEDAIASAPAPSTTGPGDDIPF